MVLACGVAATVLLGRDGDERPEFRPNRGQLGTQESLGGVPVPFPRALFRVTTMWLGTSGGSHVAIYTGYRPQMPDRGELRIVWTDPRTGLPDAELSGSYPAPAGVGLLTISDVATDVVRFRYSGGEGRFDMRARRYELSAPASASTTRS